MVNKDEYIPPEFSERLGEFGVVQLRILVGEFASGSLRPDHERVHRSLDVSHTTLLVVETGSARVRSALDPALG